MNCEKFQIRQTRIVAFISRPVKMRSSLRSRSSATIDGGTYRAKVARTRTSSAWAARQRRTKTPQAITAPRSANAMSTMAVTAMDVLFGFAPSNPVRCTRK
jgi:hypothetical protein